jgi:single-strand DNA-binding protein
MNNLRNNVQLIGRVGQNPELKTASNGNKYVSFGLATTEKYINKAGEKVENTTWHNILLWDKQAEIAEKYIAKGNEILIQAKLNGKTIVENGKNITTYDLKVTDFLLLGGGSKTATTAIPQTAAITADDLPF